MKGELAPYAPLGKASAPAAGDQVRPARRDFLKGLIVEVTPSGREWKPGQGAGKLVRPANRD